MVVSSPNPLKRTKKTKAFGVPTIDLSLKYHDKATLSRLIVGACEEFGIFKVVSHGVSRDTVVTLEAHGLEFFAQPAADKQRAGPANPFGYGCRNIGPNGDMGELEYLLIHANMSSTHPPSFRSTVVEEYVGEVGKLACELLELMAQGLWVPDNTIFSALIKDPHSDSLLRLNHYPPLPNNAAWAPPTTTTTTGGPGPSTASRSAATTTITTTSRIGFGEHSDPQILTILRSNDVAGLQICMPDGLWVPVPPDPSAFYVMVGDALQVMTNGRFVSVKHRAMANDAGSKLARMSTIYFAAPPLNATIEPIKEMVSPLSPSLYEPFTWGEYKRAMRTSRLSDCRLSLFKRRN